MRFKPQLWRWRLFLSVCVLVQSRMSAHCPCMLMRCGARLIAKPYSQIYACLHTNTQKHVSKQKKLKQREQWTETERDRKGLVVVLGGWGQAEIWEADECLSATRWRRRECLKQKTQEAECVHPLTHIISRVFFLPTTSPLLRSQNL